MKNIKLNDTLINRFFGGMDNDCLEQVKNLVEQGAVLNLNAEAPNHYVFDVCYKEDTSHLIERVEEAFPNLEGCINQLTCTDYWTDHDVYNSIIDERDARDKLLAKINAWKDSVDVFIENIGDMY